MWLEMSREKNHGGSGWAFGECLWSPARKEGGARWPFWELLPRVKKGDVVLHLRGQNKRAEFVGYSIAEADGFETSSRPPETGQWGYAKAFYRVPLTGFVPFLDAILLRQVFSARDEGLRGYFAENRSRTRGSKELLFFVVQARRLQCQNGAYLSELSERLAEIVLGPSFSGHPAGKGKNFVTARTGEQVASIKRRLGQDAFSALVRDNYAHTCCFPGCEVTDDRFLVGAHIIRWADSEEFRGKPSNGLCLCLLHDRAFELGLFTLTMDHRIALNSARVTSSPWGLLRLTPYDGRPIRRGPVVPAVESLRGHWDRIRFTPNVENGSATS